MPRQRQRYRSQPAHQNPNFVDFRKRRSYTLEEKLEIIKELESGVKQAQVAEAKRIAPSTVQNIWSTRVRVLKDYRRVRNHSLRKIPRNPRSCNATTPGTEEDGATSGGRSAKSEYADIENALMQWYTRRNPKTGITGPILKAKALQISKQFGAYDFKATQPWFDKWVATYGVTLPTIPVGSHNNNGESGKKVNGSVVNNGKRNNNGNTQNEIMVEEEEVDDNMGAWPVTVTYENGEEEMEQREGQEDDEEVLDASAFLVQSQEVEDYPQLNNQPIKEMRNGVEVIYRTRGSKGGRYKSYIWKYFREQEEEVDGGTLRYVECVFCNNRVSPKAGRMEKHLLSCEFCPVEISQNELGLGVVDSIKPNAIANRSLQNIITDDVREDDGIEIMGDEMTEDGEIVNPNIKNGNEVQEYETTSNGNGPVLKKRRTFHWTRVATYQNIEEAELALGDLSMWSRKHKHRTQQGIKTYYGCKFGRICPVQMHLLFENRTRRVVMFQTMDQHCHISKLKKRGLPRASEKPIRQLYNEGITKPSHIQQALDEEGAEVPPRYQIAYFVDKLRREENGDSSVKIESGETITIPGCGEDDLMDSWYDESNIANGDEDSSGLEILQYYGSGEGSPENNSTGSTSLQNWTEFSSANTTNNSSPSALATSNLFKSAIKLSSQGPTTEISKPREEVSIYPAVTTVQSGKAVSTVTVTEVKVSNSTNSTQHQLNTFRDETTLDGEILAPGEHNVKKRVISFIDKNFSNRDFLQIHRELLALKEAQKFTSLIRLASFTAGFLQTAFVDQQDDAK